MRLLGMRALRRRALDVFPAPAITHRILLAASLLLATLGGSDAALSAEIHDAAAINDFTEIRRLIEIDPNVVNAKDSAGMTPLHYAAQNGHRVAVELLLAHKGDPNARSSTGQTPMYFAAVPVDDKKFAEQLQRNGIAPTLLAVAEGKRSGRLDDTRLRAIYAAAALPADILAEKAVIVRLLSEHGADPSVPESVVGTTALHIAAASTADALARALVTAGAQVNAKSREGMTPLSAAAARGSKEVVEILIAAGGDVNMPGGDRGWTPLQRAAIVDNREVVAILLDV